ncbi:hypothetical protein ACTJKY_18000 [Sphingomonas sp. 22176]
MVGIALFSCNVAEPRIDFSLFCSVLEHGDRSDTLIAWLDRHLPPTGIIAGYALDEQILPAIRRLPGWQRSTAIRALAGFAPRPTIDLRGLDEEGRLTPFAEACAGMNMPASRRDAQDRFIDWTFSRSASVLHALQTDVLATFKLVLHQIRTRTALGAEVDARLQPALESWLTASDLPAAQIHRSFAA